MPDGHERSMTRDHEVEASSGTPAGQQQRSTQGRTYGTARARRYGGE